MKREFLDIISLGNCKYIKRYRLCFSGKCEIVEEPSSYEEYKQYLDSKIKKISYEK